LKSELQNQSEILGRRREVYDNVAKSLSVFLTNRVDTEEQKKKFLEAYASTWLWAPDPVVKTLNSLIDLVTVSPPSKTAEQAACKSGYANCILEMRKDSGFPTTELDSESHRFVSF